jgi:hypothetical protein
MDEQPFLQERASFAFCGAISSCLARQVLALAEKKSERWKGGAENKMTPIGLALPSLPLHNRS